MVRRLLIPAAVLALLAGIAAAVEALSGGRSRLRLSRVETAAEAEVSAADRSGRTPLHLAAGEYPDPDAGVESSAYGRNKPRLETARVLVGAGADVNAKDAHGRTRRFGAVGGRPDPALVRLLLDARSFTFTSVSLGAAFPNFALGMLTVDST